MTDDRPPIDSSDEELVSAYLDGEATPAERERVEADPRLLAGIPRLHACHQHRRESEGGQGGGHVGPGQRGQAGARPQRSEGQDE